MQVCCKPIYGDRGVLFSCKTCINWMFVMATWILGRVNADSRTTPVILPSPNGSRSSFDIYDQHDRATTLIMHKLNDLSIFILNTKLKDKGINRITDGCVWALGRFRFLRKRTEYRCTWSPYHWMITDDVNSVSIMMLAQDGKNLDICFCW